MADREPTKDEYESIHSWKPTSRQNTLWYEIQRKCRHKWQPVSFVFETELKAASGELLARQPDIDNGRVYCVCMKCHGHTYIETGWVGYYLGSPDTLEQAEARRLDRKTRKERCNMDKRTYCDFRLTEHGLICGRCGS